MGLSFVVGLMSCSIAPVTYRMLPDGIGGSVVGLAGTGLVLTNNGSDDLAISGNGVFTFATPIDRGGNYDVAVKTQPANPVQICTVSQGSGTTTDSDVSDIEVHCSTTAFTVSGSVSGLIGSGLVLENNAGDDLAVAADGSFTFATPVASGAGYAVTVKAQPSQPTQACTVTSGTGTVGDANVAGIAVACATSSFTVGGTVTGLGAGDSITVRDNGGDPIVVAADGSFTFATPVASGQPFAVTTDSPSAPISQACTVANASGTVGGANVTVAVTCTTNRFTIGATVTGLAAGDSITLTSNGGDSTVRSANGSFTFATPVASGQAYAVATSSPSSPVPETCVVTGATGTVGNANVTVTVACSAYHLVMVNDTNAHLESLDPNTLAVTDIGPLGVPYAFGDCMFNSSDGKLYMVDGRGNHGLYTVNLATGAATLIGIHNNSAMEGLAFHPPSGHIYGTSQDDTSLFTLSPATGAATLIAPEGHHLQGLAWDSKRSVMTTFDGTTMFSIDLATAALTPLATPTTVGNFGMTYDAVLDRFWVVDTSGRVLQLDPNQGFATTLNATIGGQHTCIAAVPVQVPGPDLHQPIGRP